MEKKNAFIPMAPCYLPVIKDKMVLIGHGSPLPMIASLSYRVITHRIINFFSCKHVLSFHCLVSGRHFGPDRSKFGAIRDCGGTISIAFFSLLSVRALFGV